MCADHAESGDDDEALTKVPALIVKHVRNYIFVVRFCDQTDIRVDFDKTSVWRADPGTSSETRRKLFGWAPSP
jgi:hypothetical protein